MSSRNSMSCEQVRARLPLVPGADLLPSEDAAVREHLRECADCRKDLGAYVRVRQVLREFRDETTAPRGASAAEFFTALRTDTLAAVRQDAVRRERRRRVQAPRRSFAGIMTAAALFLLGVYLAPLWQPGPSPFPEEMRTIPARAPDYVPDSRFRNVGYGVGYGLSGHQLSEPIRQVPVPEDEPELAPVRDAVEVLERMRRESARRYRK